jgi:hypothetical protein
MFKTRCATAAWCISRFAQDLLVLPFKVKVLYVKEEESEARSLSISSTPSSLYQAILVLFSNF